MLSGCDAANASFQPRLAASWMAAFIPWPVAGGVGMGSVSGQVQPSPAEPVGNAVLQPDPRGPGKLGDLRVRACLIQQRLQLSSRNRRAGVAEREPVIAGGPGGEQPPGRLLAQAEHKHQPAPPGHDVGTIIGEFDVSEQDLHGVGSAGPADASLGPHGAGRSVAAGDEAEECLGRLAMRPQDRPHTLRAIVRPD